MLLTSKTLSMASPLSPISSIRVFGGGGAGCRFDRDALDIRISFCYGTVVNGTSGIAAFK